MLNRIEITKGDPCERDTFSNGSSHQGLGQRIPEPLMLSASSPNQSGQVLSVPVLGGLHYDYLRAA